MRYQEWDKLLEEKILPKINELSVAIADNTATTGQLVTATCELVAKTIENNNKKTHNGLLHQVKPDKEGNK